MTDLCPTCGQHRKSPRRNWDRESIGIAIYQWVYDHGRPPRYEEWHRAGGTVHPSAQTVVDHFGTFSQAIRANGYKPGRASAVRRKPTRRAAA